ncbi:zinc finger CCCH domain-containing protein 30 isoform X2 [Arachis ipaensis]|uniref:C3H1-type domain-containing protein n=1 Tax=Arachis hypogaea TaxID=3818 RepID=A0A444Z986_ARAHY|nr:zinc finger CCCH domain-containing protein 30 isoform X2 [Arachis ipaensis]XP_025653574.1 zinc finger CCCH domain-containing protein 30 isoform X2 [Arachis hypogaea]QHO10822.1 Zinc finger CCCH domain-containing protein [Arachis hypogaea]RYR10745.1 hypothetical protein Ahy_B05g079224 [Arachis hypogaea]
MKRARKSKSNRVSWAPASNLCQIKLFLSDDCPSKVGLKSQDHLQAKTSSMLPSSTNEHMDLPPGFEDNHFLNQPKVELSRISPIKWERPPLFAFRHDWRVAAGEESKEKMDQKLREMKVLEAVYPRISAIPPSPSVSHDVDKEGYDDNHTPLIPIIPIEEEDSMDINPEVSDAKLADTPTKLLSQNLQQYIAAATPINSQCNTSAAVPLSAGGNSMLAISPGSEPDLAAASALVAAAILKSNEQGNPIDMDLLVKIFNDPIMIEKLVNQRGTATATITTSSNTGLKSAASGTTPTSTVGLVPSSAPKQATSLASMFQSTLNKPAIPPVPLSRPSSGNLVTSSVTLPPQPTTQSPSPPPPPPSTSTFNKHRSVNNNHVTNGALPSLEPQPPPQDTTLLSGANQVRATAATVAYQTSSTGSSFAVKDANYYKNLIRQHGADKQDGQESLIGIRHNNFQDFKMLHNLKQREVIFKNQKPCIYFNSSRGCRNGANCPYQHDISAQWGAGNDLVAQNAKRMKLGTEVNGRI